MNKIIKSKKRTEEKKLRVNKTEKNNVLAFKAPDKAKVHPFKNFIESKQNENKFSNQSHKPSTHNIPYRKKAV